MNGADHAGEALLVATGIGGLDDILCGGLTPHRLYLVEGDPGSGKTTLALQYLLEGVRQGEPALYVTLSETVAELLEMWGYQVRTAPDGVLALQVAPEFRPEVILLDISLPGMDGYEVARQLRRDPSVNGAVIVALTGYAQEEARRRSREVGFDHHLVKPVDPAELQQLLAALRAGG